MKKVKGDIWDYYKTHYIVIPTNLGWKRDGCNVMGAGLAKQAAVLFPGLPYRYGQDCKTGKQSVLIYYDLRLIMFPVKPLTRAAPHLSWKQDASVKVIYKSCMELAGHSYGGAVAIPLVGCGNGNLSRKDVLPILEKLLKGERFLLVDHQFTNVRSE